MASELYDLQDPRDLYGFTREPWRLTAVLGGGAASRREDADGALDPPPAIARSPVLEGVVGRSPSLRAALNRARKVAPTDSTVLVTGETGTGKELLARALHKWSRRANGPFVSINCAATPPTLIASELFGHERGAFTGALQRRRGVFELAAGGTLFLDEVGELPAETQVALLRVLQEREFQRVGGTASLRADVRVIAATHRDLEQAVLEGNFRSDLYYRLHVFPLEMPPLRERSGDIRLLVEHFVESYALSVGKTIRGIEPRTLEQLETHTWPGNVRELQNVVERSLIVCDSELFTLDESWLPAEAPSFAPSPANGTAAAQAAPTTMQRTPLRATLDEIQRAAILEALQACNWVIGGPQGAAALLGIKRTTLQARMRKLGMSPLRAAASAEAQSTSIPDCAGLAPLHAHPR
ncbi:MAG TPA: sigma 54-interacting transcriptional regulator [Myxococcota bacterium]|nr:sigma 54-interacting transcriptional regulator [Myxococcota bacterium]